jgi:hypothetical protein
VKGYNPHKPGRPSHTYHTYLIANLRLVLEVEVQAGNRTASKYSAPGLWELLGRVPRAHWPALLRGDRDWGSEANMVRAEQEGLPFLFKLRLTQGVKKTIERLMRGASWTSAGQGWQGAETSLPLQGWSRARRTVVLRRQIRANLALVDQSDPEQLRLSFAELTDDTIVYEYAVLVTSLTGEILTIAQLYRDRADAEIYQPCCLRKKLNGCGRRRRWRRYRRSWSSAAVLGVAHADAQARRRRPKSATAVSRHAAPGGPAASPCAAS